MRPFLSLLISLVVAVVALWLFIKLLGLALKLVGVAIAVILAVVTYFVVERLIRRLGHA